MLHRKNILLFVIMRSEAQTLFESMTDEEMYTALLQNQSFSFVLQYSEKHECLVLSFTPAITSP